MRLKQTFFKNYILTSNFFKRQVSAFLSESKEDLVVHIEEKQEKFPLVWLRDNCTCESCFHKDSTSRIINWKQFDVSPKVEAVQTTPDKSLILKWDDRHVSKFNIEWLKQRSFRKEVQDEYLIKNYKPMKVPWNTKTIQNFIKKYDYEHIMKSDQILYNWMVDLARYGVVFTDNVPVDKRACATLANRIAFIRRTHYEEEYEIKTKPVASSVVFLPGGLQLHTDLTYYEYTPGTTMLHCLTEADGNGGESLLSDALYNVEELRKKNKEAFDILSNVEVNWFDLGLQKKDKYYSINRCPVIRLDWKGNFEKVYLSVPKRDSHFTVDLEYVKPWYKALKAFVDQLYSNVYKFKLKSGQILTFDNTRLVHGRSEYADTAAAQRHLIGCYVDWDEIYSKIRVLKAKQ